jgi:hypothetical protein
MRRLRSGSEVVVEIQAVSVEDLDTAGRTCLGGGFKPDQGKRHAQSGGKQRLLHESKGHAYRGHGCAISLVQLGGRGGAR